ncbi:hypothetical protein G7046_g7812 [Stylonectria norvegica]|nr:hypothetical protein G7046_g7812 [Stylonectria norvegica]
MLASGVCRSDHSLLTIDKQASWFQEKYTLGDVVALHAVPGCGEQDCPECSRDLSQICERGHHSGIGQDGFYAPYAAVDVRGAVLVPEGVTPAEAAVATDAVNTAYHAIHRRGEVKKTETVFLFGLGGLGFNALQIVLEIGARVIVSDIREERLQEAAKLGVPRGDIVPVGKLLQEFIAENDLRGKIDTVLDFVGTHQTFDDAQEIVRRGGKLLCVGTLNTENTVRMKTAIRKRLSYIFSYGGQVRDLEKVLDLIAKKAIQPQVEEGKLEDFPTILAALGEGKVKGRMALIHD